MGISSFLKGEINRKISHMKEDWERKKIEDEAYRDAVHRERIASAPTRAKAIERATLRQEIKGLKKGGGKGGWRQGIENFATNMTNPSYSSGGGGGGANMGWILGGGGGGGRTSGKRHRKTKSKKGKRK